MNPAYFLSMPLHWPGVLALEITAAVAAAWACQFFVTSPHWRRMLWQVCVVSLCGLLAVEIVGLDSLKIRRVVKTPSPKAEAKIVPDAQAPIAAAVETIAAPTLKAAILERPAAITMNNTIGPAIFTATDGELMDAAITFIWIGGMALVLLRIAAARLLLLLFRRRCGQTQDRELLDQAQNLAIGLGWTGKLRLLTGSRLSGPISFGVFRATIVLPENMNDDAEKREAILAHEIAHLAGRDPAWHLLADIACAALWWHPLAWWARRQLHVASELVADEASQLVDDGPANLASCLVELGRKQINRRALASIGMAGSGFRSALGRRLQRLIRMDGSWNPPRLSQVVIARMAGPALLVTAVILCSAWAVPRQTQEGNSMIHARQTLRHSFSVMALIANMGWEPQSAKAAETTGASQTGAPPSISPATGPSGLDIVSNDAIRSPLEQGRQRAINNKLNSIIFNEISFDKMTLQAAVKLLDEKIRQLDPEKTGVNFLISELPARQRGVSPPDSAMERRTLDERRQGIENLRQLLVGMDGQIRSLQERIAKMQTARTMPEAANEDTLTTPFPDANQAVRQLISQLITEEDIKRENIDATVKNLESMEKSKMTEALPTVFPDPLLNNLLSRRSQLEQELAITRKDFADEHPNVQRTLHLLTSLDRQIDLKTESTLMGYRIISQMLRAQCEAQRKEFEQARMADLAGAILLNPVEVLKMELESEKSMHHNVQENIDHETEILEFAGNGTNKIESLEKLLAKHDQKVKQMQEQLNRMTSGREDNSAAPNLLQRKMEESTLYQLQTNLVLIKAEIFKREKTMEILKKLEPLKRRLTLPTVFPDPLLSELLIKDSELQEQLAGLKQQYSAIHPDVIKVVDVSKKIDSQIDKRMEGVFAGIQAQIDSYKAQNKAFLKTRQNLANKDASIADKSDALANLQSDLESRKRIRETVKLRLTQEQVDLDLPRSMPQNVTLDQARTRVPSVEKYDIKAVMIDFSQPLRHVRAIDVLDAITRAASRPVAYSVQDYGVVFSKQ